MKQLQPAVSNKGPCLNPNFANHRGSALANGGLKVGSSTVVKSPEKLRLEELPLSICPVRCAQSLDLVGLLSRAGVCP